MGKPDTRDENRYARGNREKGKLDHVEGKSHGTEEDCDNPDYCYGHENHLESGFHLPGIIHP